MDVSEQLSGGQQPDTDTATADLLERLKLKSIWMCAPAEGGKNPLDARTGLAGSPIDPAHWADHATAAATAQREGLLLGVALGPIPGGDMALVGVDIDAAASKGSLKPFAQRVYDLLPGWLWEKSRSKKGLHGYALVAQNVAAQFEPRRIKKMDPKTGLEMGLEFYPRERFFIWTGDTYEGRAALTETDAETLEKLKLIYDEFEAIEEDIHLAALMRLGKIKELGRPKKGLARWNVDCPWKDGHTKGQENDSEAMYVPPQDGRPPGFDCRHNHCAKKKIKALNEWLKDNDPQFKDDLAEWARKQREARAKAGEAGTEFPEAMLGQMFVHQYGKDYRYNHTRECWMEWVDTHWQEQETKLVVEIIKKLAIQIGPPGKSTLKAAQVFNAEKLARSDLKVAMTNDKFDANPDLFNHLGGTLNTVTMETREHRREDYLTKCAAAKPEGGCPTWDAFIARIMADDADMAAYLQRLMGSTLTGEVKDKKFFELWGDGDNGKTVFIEMWGKVLGDYADAVTPELFVMTKHEPHPTARADLAGLRLAYTSELEAGQTWNVELIKRITGGDTIRARRMHENFWKFKAQCKLVIAGNHKLNLRRVGKAIKTRLHLIPFTVSIPEHEQDKDLPAKLWRERDGILARMVEGLRDWRRVGLVPPKQVLDATTAYFEEQDTIGNWASECCIIDKPQWGLASDLYGSFKEWCERNGEFVPSQKHFGMQLGERGFTQGKHPKSRQVTWSGIGLKPDDGTIPKPSVGGGSSGSKVDPFL